MKGKRIIKDQSALGQFSSAIAQICDEKGIDKEKVVESIEYALAAAYKKDYGKKGQIIVAKMDEKTGAVEFKQLKEVVDESNRTIEDEFIPDDAHDLPKKAHKSEEVVERIETPDMEDADVLPKFNPERDVLIKDAKKLDKALQVGDFLEIPLETKEDYGRVASQTAKQVIIQRIREAERDSMYDEYKSKEGEVINGTVQRIEMDRVYVDIGKATGVLFPSEQIPGENYRIGQRLRVFIEKVESDPKGPGITLSRRSPELLAKLFELEVPEIFSGTVELKAVAREAGSRSKIAVSSNEDGVDPIGSCVGQKGTRVQAVIDEIGGEKIDIIEWSDDVEKLIASALSPAKVIKVDLNEENKEALAHVEQDQLSLAIGRKGQNVRLAAKLTGWKIDVEGVGEAAEDESESSDAKALEDKKSKVESEDADAEDKSEKDSEEKVGDNEKSPATPKATQGSSSVASDKPKTDEEKKEKPAEDKKKDKKDEKSDKEEGKKEKPKTKKAKK